MEEVVGENSLIALLLLVRIPLCLDGVIFPFFFMFNTQLTALMLQLQSIGSKCSFKKLLKEIYLTDH